jgi:hypothetical protein
MGTRQGWTGSPDSRGTIDIIYDCATTAFLCCWSVLVLNVPKPDSSTLQNIVHKLLLVALCALAPELILQMAMGQWLQARRGRTLFHKSGYSQWTLRHSFYADMGGIHLQSPGWKSFPVDTKQLHYLITKGYVSYPSLNETNIRDRDRVDGMLRFITLVQVLCFVINIMGRVHQNLTITVMELSTSAFVVLNIGTTLCWLRKPADVEHPDYITTDTSIADILCDAGDAAAGVYQTTPLDFASRREWHWSILWAHGLALLRSFRLAAPPMERPALRFQNTTVPFIEGAAQLAFAAITMGYFAIFTAAWNYSFPTKVEQMLWRVASLTALSTAFTIIFSMHFFFSWCPALQEKIKSAIPHGNAGEAPGTNQGAHQAYHGQRGMIKRFLDYLRNNSLTQDPALTAPLGAILVTWFCGVFYCASRLYILVADCMELRSLPSNAYRTVDWSQYWPRF